jgi:hypothetical protein
MTRNLACHLVILNQHIATSLKLDIQVAIKIKNSKIYFCRNLNRENADRFYSVGLYPERQNGLHADLEKATA